jgi:ABC-type Mn2+/Zn2+ transport system ATPase subunit
METIVINIHDKSKTNQILDAVRLLKGVKNAAIATDEELENISILKACKSARKSAKATKQDVLNALR